MFFVFWLLLHSLSSPANASTHPSCAMYFDLYMRSLFSKPKMDEIYTPSYFLAETSRRLRESSGTLDYSKIIGSHYDYESLKNWKMKIPNLNQLKQGAAEVKVWNTKTGESKIVSVPIDLEAQREQLFFSNLKIKNGFKVPKTKLDEYTKATVATYEMDKSTVAAALYYAPESTIKAESAFFQKTLHHSAQVTRLQGILKGTTPLDRLEDLIGVNRATVDWAYLAKQANLKADQNFLRYHYDGQIYAARLQESAQFHGMSSDEAFNAFLLQIHDHNASKFANKAYGVSFTHVDEQGKSLNFHYLDAGRMNELDQRKWMPEAVEEQWMNAPEDVRKYVEASYRKRLNLSEAQLKKLMEISRSMQARTDYLFIADEPFAKITSQERQRWIPGEQRWEMQTSETYKPFDHFTVKGSMSMVYSSSAKEPLPLELFTGVKIVRPKTGKVVEIGRFTVDPELRPLGPKHIWKAVAAAAAKDGVAKICAETTEEYAKELIDKFGFKKIAERLNFEGKPEYIIEVTPQEFFKNSVLNGVTE